MGWREKLNWGGGGEGGKCWDGMARETELGGGEREKKLSPLLIWKIWGEM